MVAIYFACVIVCLLLILVHFTRKRYNYWKVRNVAHPKPTWLFGNFKDYIFLKTGAGSIEQEICHQFPNEPYVGVYYGTEPTLVIQDPDIISFVTSKEFNSFNGREISNYCYHEIITDSIFYTFGEKWRASKQALSPTFTLSRLKNMYHMIERCAVDLEKMLRVEIGMSSTADVRDLMARYTMDCICSCVHGVSPDTMNTTDFTNPFKIMGQRIFEVSPSRNFWYVIRSIWPFVFYGLKFKVFPEQINNFFRKLYQDVCKDRQYKPSTRNDLVDHLLDAKIEEDIVVGYLVSLFGAGYETSANTMSLTLYELAKNRELQDRAFKEVDEFLLRNDGKIKYECFNELQYLYACVSETMRMYPVLSVITREAMEDCTLPTGLKVEKGTRIHIPVYHLHHNPDHFSDPEVYRPERFLHDTIKPFTFLPYGEGRRLCIGKQFSKMQMMPCLVTVLRYYRLELAENMSETMEFEVGSIITQPKGPIRLKFTPREKDV